MKYLYCGSYEIDYKNRHSIEKEKRSSKIYSI